MYFSVFVVALWKEYTGALMELCQGRRGTLVDMKFVTSTRGSIVYEIPLAEVTRRRDSCSTWYSIYFLREWLLLLLLVVVVVVAKVVFLCDCFLLSLLLRLSLSSLWSLLFVIAVPVVDIVIVD